jgi:hypothetical protein
VGAYAAVNDGLCPWPSTPETYPSGPLFAEPGLCNPAPGLASPERSFEQPERSGGEALSPRVGGPITGLPLDEGFPGFTFVAVVAVSSRRAE